jgi:N-acyl-D-aspartate/D-glutamate deacylase
MLDTFNFATVLLEHGVRRQQVLSLEEGVRQLTSVPADLYGLSDRGRLVPGAVADVVVFDEATIGSRQTETRADLPGGAARLYAEADGIDRVLVGGREIAIDGKFTGDRPGRMLRSGRDTKTPALM